MSGSRSSKASVQPNRYHHSPNHHFQRTFQNLSGIERLKMCSFALYCEDAKDAYHRLHKCCPSTNMKSIELCVITPRYRLYSFRGEHFEIVCLTPVTIIRTRHPFPPMFIRRPSRRDENVKSKQIFHQTSAKQSS